MAVEDKSSERSEYGSRGQSLNDRSIGLTIAIAVKLPADLKRCCAKAKAGLNASIAAADRDERPENRVQPRIRRAGQFSLAAGEERPENRVQPRIRRAGRIDRDGSFTEPRSEGGPYPRFGGAQDSIDDGCIGRSTSAQNFSTLSRVSLNPTGVTIADPALAIAPAARIGPVLVAATTRTIDAF